MSFVTSIYNANLPLSAVLSAVSEAETHAIAGDNEHGKAGLMRIAALAVAIHKEVSFHNMVFTKEMASHLARAWFDRTRYLDPWSANATVKDAIWDGPRINPIVSRVCAVLHPYVIDGQPFGIKLEDGSVIGDPSKSRKDVEKALGYGKGKNLKKIVPVATIRQLDAVDRARTNTKRSLKLACLYVHLDQNMTLLEQFDRTKGLLIRDAWVLPIEHGSKGRKVWLPNRGHGDDATVYLPSMAAEQVIVLGKIDKGTAGQEIETFRATLEQFRKVWNEPKDTASSDAMVAALTVIADSLNIRLAGMPSENLEKLVLKAKSAIHTYEEAVARTRAVVVKGQSSKDATPIVTKDAPEPATPVEPTKGKNKPSGYKHSKANGDPIAA